MAAIHERASASERREGFEDRARLVCTSGDATYPTRPEPIYQCINQHKPTENLLEVVYDFPRDLDPEKLKLIWLQRKMSNDPLDTGIWRFSEFFPFIDDPSNIVTMGEGNTRLIEGIESAEYAGLRRLTFKHQGDNPTGSFKDTGMSAGISAAKMLGMEVVACASTGNTSASMAAYAKRAGMLPVVLLPEGKISSGKLAQALDYGALTIQVPTDFDGVMKLIMEVAPQAGIYVVNSINPFRIEGQKTMIVELLEQRNWQVPDRIVVPGGNLGHASSIWKALRELKELGFIDRLPLLNVIQAAGADPLYQSVTAHSGRLVPMHPRTLATAIQIGNPVSFWKAMDGVKQTGGWVEEVTEQEIADARAVIGRDGIGCEPASAVTLAGLRKMVKKGTDRPLDPEEDVVAILTGNVLKDTPYAIAYHGGQLSEEYSTETTYTQRGLRIEPTYGNQLIQVDADPDAIIDIIRKRMAA